MNEMDACENEMDDYESKNECKCKTYNKILLWSERKASVMEWNVLTKVAE